MILVDERVTYFGLTRAYSGKFGRVVYDIAPEGVAVHPSVNGKGSHCFKSFLQEWYTNLLSVVNEFEYEEIIFMTANHKLVRLICKGLHEEVPLELFDKVGIPEGMRVYKLSLENIIKLKEQVWIPAQSQL